MRTIGLSPQSSDFAGRTVAGVAEALERVVFSEELARLPGFLQSVDPRAKTVAILLLLLATGLARHLVVVAAIYALGLLAASLSRLPLGDFTRRVWLGVPLFAGVVVLPSLFLLPGTPLLTLLDLPPLWLAITDNGVSSALLLLARVGTSVSLALLLVTTTRWAEVLKALRALRLPEAFVVVLGMTYRYLFLFLHAANNMFMARRSRTVGVTSSAEQRRWAAGAAGSLVGRSLKLSDDVLLAMRARGFAGDIRTLGCSRAMRDEDWLLLAVVAAVGAALMLLDRSLW